jgi:hypothetical protein
MNWSYGRGIFYWAAILVVLLCWPNETRAVATLRMSTDGGVSWTNVVDNSPMDSNPDIGRVVYSGGLGNGWFFASIVGSHDNYPEVSRSVVDLGCLVLSTGGGSLIAQFSDDGLGPIFGHFYSAVGGTTDGKASFKTRVDPTNSLFSGRLLMDYGDATEVCTNESDSAPFRLTNYSMTLEAVITLPSGGSTGFDMEAVAITESPVIVPILSNGVVCLTFPTRVGFSYGLEYKNNLSDNDWLPLQSVPGTDSMLTLTDAPPVTISRFYRVNVQ